MTEHYSHVEVDEKQRAASAVLKLVSASKSGTSGGTSTEDTSEHNEDGESGTMPNSP